MENLAMAGAAALPGTASRPESIARGEPVAELLSSGVVTSLADRLAIGIRLGRLVSRHHHKGECYGHLDLEMVELTDTEEIVVSHRPTQRRESITADTRAYGHIVYQLLLGNCSEERDCEELVRAGYAQSLVRAVQECTEETAKGAALDHLVRELQHQLRMALGEEERKRMHLTYILIAVAVLLAIGFASRWVF